MSAEGHKVASLHGAKDAGERDAIIDRFREGREKVDLTFILKMARNILIGTGPYHYKRYRSGYRYSSSKYGGQLRLASDE